MSFLEIDGWAVSTAKGGSHDEKLDGDFTPAYDGTPMSDIRYRQRTHKHTTNPLDSVSAEALIGQLMRKGQSWDWSDPDDPYTSSLNSFRGLVPDTGTALTPNLGIGSDGRPLYSTSGIRESKFNNFSLMLTDAYTNLFAAGVRNPTDYTTFTAINSATLSDNYDGYVVGSQSVQVSAAFAGRGIATPMTTVGGTSDHTLSAYIYAGNTNVEVQLIAEGDVSGDLGTQNYTLTQGRWQRVSISVSSGSEATIRLRIESVANHGTWLVDAFQYTSTPDLLPWADGSVAVSDDLTYTISTLANARGFTISTWMYVQGVSTQFFKLSAASGNQSIIVRDNVVTITNIVGDTDTLSYTSISDTDWKHILLTLRPKRESDGSFEIEMFVDGTSVDSENSGADPTIGNIRVSQLTKLYFGPGSGAGTVQNMLFDDFRIYPFGVSTEIAGAWASQTVKPGRVPRVRLSGSVVQNPAGVEAEGIFDGAEVFGSYDANGVWRPQHRRVSFSLAEIPE